MECFKCSAVFIGIAICHTDIHKHKDSNSSNRILDKAKWTDYPRILYGKRLCKVPYHNIQRFCKNYNHIYYSVCLYSLLPSQLFLNRRKPTVQYRPYNSNLLCVNANSCSYMEQRCISLRKCRFVNSTAK